MATYFSEGTTYSKSNTSFGLRPYDEQNNTASASQPSPTLICVAATKTHVVFKFTNPTGSGPTANVGWLLGQTQRCRIQRDATGFYAMPMNRAYGRVIVRP
jgi:hypothetical protein